MELDQFELMNRVEERHWWYLGLRDLLERCWGFAKWKLPPHPKVLDAGCGTGGNLKFFHRQLSPSYLGGFDLSNWAVEAARQKCDPQVDAYVSDICQPELHARDFDLIFSCDCIYVPGWQAARSGLESLVAALRPGGQFVLHLPAYNWLKSHHDRAVHTKERYTLSQTKQMLKSLGLECCLASYRLCGLLPIVIVRRLPSLLRITHDPTSRDMELPSPWLNGLLLRYLRAENRWIARGNALPWGSSIVAIGRKPHYF